MTRCVICRQGELRPGTTQAELKVGADRILVAVEAEVCAECGEAYFSAGAMQRLERVRDDFNRKAIQPQVVGSVYQAA